MIHILFDLNLKCSDVKVLQPLSVQVSNQALSCKVFPSNKLAINLKLQLSKFTSLNACILYHIFQTQSLHKLDVKKTLYKKQLIKVASCISNFTCMYSCLASFFLFSQKLHPKQTLAIFFFETLLKQVKCHHGKHGVGKIHKAKIISSVASASVVCMLKDFLLPFSLTSSFWRPRTGEW